MKRFTLFIVSLFLFLGASFAQNGLNQTVVFDFTTNDWGIPDYSPAFKQINVDSTYTCGDWTIQIVPNTTSEQYWDNGELKTSTFAGYYYYDNKDNFNSSGTNSLRIAYQGTKIVLPVFTFPVERIVVEGHPSVTSFDSKVEKNIYVGNTAVSTSTMGTSGVYEYMIAEEYQKSENPYELVIESGGRSSILHITAIKVYPAASGFELKAPEFDVPSGVYTEPQQVTISSATASLEGVSNVVYYYTTNGDKPDVELLDGTETGVVTIDKSCTLKALVSLEYEEDTYISEVTSVDYIISKSVKAAKAETAAAGYYFISAENRIATLYGKGNLVTKEMNELQNEKIADAKYFAFTFEEVGDQYYIKDGAGYYITAPLNGELIAGKYPNTPWSVYINEGVAEIRSGGFILVYDAGSEAFVIIDERAVNEQTVLPVLYYHVPIEVVVAAPAESVEKLSTISLTFNKVLTADWAAAGIEAVEVKDAAGDVVASTLVENIVVENNVVVMPLDKEIVKVGKYTMELPGGVVADVVDGEFYDGGNFEFEVFTTLECVNYTPEAAVDTLVAVVLEFDDKIEAVAEVMIDVLHVDSVVATIDTKNVVVKENFLEIVLDAPILETGVYAFTVPADVVVSVRGAYYAGGEFIFEVVAPEVENGIDAVAAEKNVTIHDLAGRRVKAVTMSGVYIVDGKKVVK